MEKRKEENFPTLSIEDLKKAFEKEEKQLENMEIPEEESDCDITGFSNFFIS